MSNGNESAYPGQEPGYYEDGTFVPGAPIPGLTKRELFAAMCLQGLCAAPDIKDTSHENMAQHSVKYADALLAELAKEAI